MTNKDIERVVEEAFEFFNNNPTPTEIRDWLRTTLTAMYEQGVRDAMAGVPEVHSICSRHREIDKDCNICSYARIQEPLVRTMREHCQSLLKADK
jgi:hypothetical protein